MDGVNGKAKDIKAVCYWSNKQTMELDWPFLEDSKKESMFHLPTLEARQNLFDLYTAVHSKKIFE